MIYTIHLTILNEDAYEVVFDELERVLREELTERGKGSDAREVKLQPLQKLQNTLLRVFHAELQYEDTEKGGSIRIGSIASGIIATLKNKYTATYLGERIFEWHEEY